MSMRAKSARALRGAAFSGHEASVTRCHARPITTLNRPAEAKHEPATRYPPRRHALSSRRLATASEVPSLMTGTTSVPASTDLLELYRGMVAQGRLKWDDEQVRCVIKVCPGGPPAIGISR